MPANDLSFFCTITISTITTIITLSTFTYIKNLYTQILDKIVYKDKEIQTNIKVMFDSETQTDIKVMVDSETQTDIKVLFDSETQTKHNNDIDINYDSYVEIEYISYPKAEDSLENLILLAKNQLIIQQNPSKYKWFFLE